MTNIVMRVLVCIMFAFVAHPGAAEPLRIYAAGSLTDHGTPALAYNEKIHEQTEKQIYGDPRIRKIFQRDALGRIAGFVERRESWDIVWLKVA